MKNRDRFLRLIEHYKEITEKEHVTSEELYYFVQDHRCRITAYFSSKSRREIAMMLTTYAGERKKQGRKTIFFL